MNKTILENPEYLNITYSKEKAPYGEYPFFFGKHLLKEYYKKPGKILDLGCGRGEYVKVFSDLKFDSYGLDISPKAVECSDPNKVSIANLEKAENPHGNECFDFVFSKSVIEHMQNPTSLLKVSYDCLKPGGTAIIMTPSWVHNYKAAFYIDHTHITPFTKPSLEDALRMSGFEDIKVKYFYQIPTLWKYPFLTLFSKATSLFPIPYAPLNDVPWAVSNKMNKYVRFSKEVMLFAVAKK